MAENIQPAGAPAPAEQPTAPASDGFVDHEATEPTTDETVAEPQPAEGEAAEEATTDEQDGEDTPSKPKRESGSQRLKRKIERLEAQLAENRRSAPAQSEDIGAEVEKIIGKPPNPNDEKYKSDYLALERDLTAYELDKRQTSREVKARNERQASQQAEIRRELAEAHSERIEEFRAKAQDFDDVMKGAGELKAAPVVEDLILESDKSAHLVYYLAKNPAKLDALNRLNERAAAREIGRIEAQLSLPQPKKATAATKPAAPLKGGAAPTPNLADVPMSEYVRLRRAQDKEA